jgi:thiosulfate/3-mercaptopyruvate sulfurtransferase
MEQDNPGDNRPPATAPGDRVDSAAMRDFLLSRRQFALAAGALATTAASPVRAQTATDEPYVVDPAWLQARLAADPNVVLLDVSALRTYRAEHIRGAIHCWWQDTMELNNVVYGTTLSTGGTAARAQLMEALGIDDSTMVVAYDNEDNRSAARMVWFLRWLNHGAAAMLDGGLAAWKTANGAVESGANDAAKRGVPTIKEQSSLLMLSARLVSRVQAGQSLIVDVRTDAEARDTANGISNLGRIPTSISFPWTNTITDHKLKPIAELTALLTQAGIVPAKEVVLYARYGVEAAQAWVVLKLLGFARVSIYDLGFVGWQASPSRTIEPLPPS